MFSSINQVSILSVGISVSASIMGHTPFYGLHLDDDPLGPSVTQPSGFCSGWRRQDEVEDLGAGGAPTGTSQSLTKHR